MAIWDDVITERERREMARGFADEYVGFGQKPAVLVVDMANAFVDDRFPTANSATGRPCTEAIARLLGVARARRIGPIVYTTYSPRDVAQGWARWKGAFLRTPSLRTEEAFAIAPALAPAADDRVLVKTGPSAFFGTPLASLLAFHGVDTVIVTGMVTSGCIRATVVDAFSYNYRTIVPVECVADRSDLSHKVNLFEMHMKYADVRPLDEVIADLEQLPSDRGVALRAGGIPSAHGGSARRPGDKPGD